VTCSRRLIWPTLFNPKYEIFVNDEKHFVKSSVLQLYITLFCRFDDIQDNSALRRGVPAAHSVYGVASTINSAICVHLISVQRALSSNHADMLKLYTEMNLDVWRGIESEIYWRDNHICPSETKYLEMAVRSKHKIRAMSRI